MALSADTTVNVIRINFKLNGEDYDVLRIAGKTDVKALLIIPINSEAIADCYIQPDYNNDKNSIFAGVFYRNPIVQYLRTRQITAMAIGTSKFLAGTKTDPLTGSVIGNGLDHVSKLLNQGVFPKTENVPDKLQETIKDLTRHLCD